LLSRFGNDKGKTNVNTGKVWSLQSADEVHVAPLASVKTPFVPTVTDSDHTTTVHKIRGKVSVADPIQMKEFKGDASTVPRDTVFTPKISTTEIYSDATSPTAHFESAVPPIVDRNSHAAPSYETNFQSKVFGGQDTLASTKKHPTGVKTARSPSR
jgi:hypothetical protein